MAEKDSTYMINNPLFSHLKPEVKQKNFFKSLTGRGLTGTLSESPKENQEDLPPMAGNGLFFPTMAAALQSQALESNKHLETGTRPGIESSLVRLHQSCLLANKLGKGSFGSVYEARDKVTGSLRAVKIIALKQGSASLSQSIESKLHKAMSDAGQNVPIYYDSWIEIKKEVIIMEHCESTLANRIDALRFADKTVSEVEIRKIVSQLVPTLSKLHSLGYAHMDVKPENILFSSIEKPKNDDLRMLDEGDHQEMGNSEHRVYTNLTVSGEQRCGYLLTDFGISTPITNGISDFDILEGDQRYMPLEVFDLKTSKKSQLDLTKVDIFSLGLIFLQLMTGIDLTDRGLEWSNLRSDDYVSSLLANTQYSNNLKKVVISCLRKEPSQRPTLREILFEIILSTDFTSKLTEKRESTRLIRRQHCLKASDTRANYHRQPLFSSVNKVLMLDIAESVLPSYFCDPHFQDIESIHATE